MLDVVHDDEPRAVAVRQEAEGGVEGEAGDGGGRLAVDPGGETHQVGLVTRRLLHLPGPHLGHTNAWLVIARRQEVSFKKGYNFSTNIQKPPVNGLFKSNFITDIPINLDNAIHGLNVIYPPTVTSSNSNGFGICGEKFQPAAGPIFTVPC